MMGARRDIFVSIEQYIILKSHLRSDLFRFIDPAHRPGILYSMIDSMHR